MAESQAERLKKELRFLKESYEAGIINEEEFNKGKNRIESKLAEWGEGVVEEYGNKEAIDELEEETTEEQSSSESQKSRLFGKQEKLESFEEKEVREEKPKPRKKAVKKTEKPRREAFKEKTKTSENKIILGMKTMKKQNILRIATAVLIIILIILFFRKSGTADLKVDADMIVLNDKNCVDCDTTSAENVIDKLFPGLTKSYVDYNTDQGKEIYNGLGIEYLPAYIFKDKIEGMDTWKNNVNIKNSFEKKKGHCILLASQTGSEWKP